MVAQNKSGTLDLDGFFALLTRNYPQYSNPGLCTAVYICSIVPRTVTKVIGVPRYPDNNEHLSLGLSVTRIAAKLV